MTVYEATSLAVASIAVLMSGYALWISVPLRRQQRRELEEARARRQQADVRVKLVSCFGRRDRVVVENRGEGTARAVHLKIEPPTGLEDPVSQYEYAKKLPIEVLRGGESASRSPRPPSTPATLSARGAGGRTKTGSSRSASNDCRGSDLEGSGGFDGLR